MGNKHDILSRLLMISSHRTGCDVKTSDMMMIHYWVSCKSAATYVCHPKTGKQQFMCEWQILFCCVCFAPNRMEAKAVDQGTSRRSDVIKLASYMAHGEC